MKLWRKAPDLTLLLALWLLLLGAIAIVLPQMLAAWSLTSILRLPRCCRWWRLGSRWW